MVFRSLASPLTPSASPLYQRLPGGAWAMAVVFRANAAVNASANSAARAATLYLFLFFMVESALGFLFWLRAPDKFFLAHALQFFARVNNRPENCKQKIKIFKRIFGQRRPPLASLVWSRICLPLASGARCLKEGQFYSSDIPVVAAVSAANPRMVQATRLPLQKKSAGRTNAHAYSARSSG